MQTILETERLLLRTLAPSDFEDLCALLEDAEVMAAWEHGFSREEAAAWYAKQIVRYREYGFGLWTVIEKKSGEFLGQCGLSQQKVFADSNMNKRLDISKNARETEVLEVGFLFKRKFWGCGFAYESASACIRYAFERLGEQSVFAIIRDNNERAARLARRLGMQKTASFTRSYRGKAMPHDLYVLDKGN